jgi:hypothetical protein
MSCCGKSCPCPAPPECGGLWEKIKEAPCCVCPLDDGVNCTAYSEATPHRSWKGCCECECDKQAGGQTGSYTYDYDSEGNAIDRRWSGECDQDGPTPDWNGDKCICYCKLAEDGCENPNEELNTDTCECDCQLTDDDCTAPTPSLDADLCECVECNRSPGECTGGTPSLNTDTCECYCQYDDPNSGNTCPPETPSVDSSDCSCKCWITEDDCSDSEFFDSSTCACKPCTNVCEPGQSYVKTCTCDGCPSDKLTCDDGSCIDQCPPSTPNTSYTFNSASCSCDYTAHMNRLYQELDLLP